MSKGSLFLMVAIGCAQGMAQIMAQNYEGPKLNPQQVTIVSGEVARSSDQEFALLQKKIANQYDDIKDMQVEAQSLNHQRTGLMERIKATTDREERAKLNATLRELNQVFKDSQRDMQKRIQMLRENCQDESKQINSKFKLVDDNEKTNYNKAGFNCQSGEKLATSNNRKTSPHCSPMNLVVSSCKIPFDYEDNRATQLACVNKDDVITATADYFDGKYIKTLGNITRYQFSGKKITGFEQDDWGIKTSVAVLDNGKLKKVQKVGDTLISECSMVVENSGYLNLSASSGMMTSGGMMMTTPIEPKSAPSAR